MLLRFDLKTILWYRFCFWWVVLCNICKLFRVLWIRKRIYLVTDWKFTKSFFFFINNCFQYPIVVIFHKKRVWLNKVSLSCWMFKMFYLSFFAILDIYFSFTCICLDCILPVIACFLLTITVCFKNLWEETFACYCLHSWYIITSCGWSVGLLVVTSSFVFLLKENEMCITI